MEEKWPELGVRIKKRNNLDLKAVNLGWERERERKRKKARRRDKIERDIYIKMGTERKRRKKEIWKRGRKKE